VTDANRPSETVETTGGEIPTLVIVMVGFLITVLITAVTVLTVLEKPVDNVLVIVGAFIAPTVTSLLATRRISALDKKVDKKLDNLITDKAELENQVAGLGDIPITLPARRPTDTRPQPRFTEGKSRHGR
jgi:hypothetical protein